MQSKTILIFTAVNAETQAIKRAMHGSACRIVTVGIGARHLPTVEELANVSIALVCGLGGALDPSLAIGDVVIDDPKKSVPRIIFSQTETTAPGSVLGGLVSVRRGIIHTADQIIASPAAKAELFDRTQALAVDMEQAMIAKFISGLGIELIGVRAVSDTANQTLDPVVRSFIDDMGHVRPANIAISLVRRPGMIRYLLQLNKNTNIALRELGKVVKAIVDELGEY